MAKRAKVKSHEVFLNVPYDNPFAPLYLAYIVAVSSFGLVPRATIGLAGETRLDRIARLIESCPYSVHDLSRVQLDRAQPATPRFNMPFELGLAVGWARSRAGRSHRWIIFESKLRRIQKSLSDLNGTDPYIHGGTVRGVMREMRNAFISFNKQPTVPVMMEIYNELFANIPAIKRSTGSKSVFTAGCFTELSFVAAALARKHGILP